MRSFRLMELGVFSAQRQSAFLADHYYSTHFQLQRQFSTTSDDLIMLQPLDLDIQELNQSYQRHKHRLTDGGVIKELDYLLKLAEEVKVDINQMFKNQTTSPINEQELPFIHTQCADVRRQVDRAKNILLDSDQNTIRHMVVSTISAPFSDIQKQIDRIWLQEEDMHAWQTWGASYQPQMIKKDKEFSPCWNAHLDAIKEMAQTKNRKQASPTVFISYAWPMSDTYFSEERGLQSFLLRLREDLRHAGLTVYLDLTDLPNNESVFAFAKMIETVDYVLQPCTPSLCEKDVNLGYNVIQRELAHIRNRKDVDQKTHGESRIYPFVFAGPRKQAILPENLYQDIVLDWRRQSYIKNVHDLLNHFLPFIARENEYKAIWSGLLASTGYRYPMDKSSVMSLQREEILKKQYDQLSNEIFYQNFVNLYYSESPSEVKATYRRRGVLKKQSNFDLPVDYFVAPQAYEELFSALKDYLQNPGKKYLGITGIAGSGKSQLAAYLLNGYISHVAQHITKEQLPVLYQLDMSNKTNFTSDLLRLWNHISNLEGKPALDKITEEDLQWIWKGICERIDRDYPGSVLLFDNVDDREIFEQYLIPKGHSSDENGLCVIVTTQDEQFHVNHENKRISLSKGLTEKEALILLEKKSELVTEGNNEARNLVNTLDRLPHSIVFAGSYVLRERASFGVYINKLEKSLKSLKSLERKQARVIGGMKDYKWTAIKLSVDQLIPEQSDDSERIKEGKAAYALLLYSSLMHPEKIPVSLLERCMESLDGVEASDVKECVGDGIDRAKAYSLVRTRYEGETQLLTFHRSVQRVMWSKWDELGKDVRTTQGHAIIGVINEMLIPQLNSGLLDLQRWRMYLPHMRQAFDMCGYLRFEENDSLMSPVSYNIGHVLNALGFHQEALSYLYQSLKRYETLRSAQVEVRPQIADARIDICLILAKRDPTQALDLYQKTLKLLKNLYPQQSDRRIARLLSAMGIAYGSKPLPEFEKALHYSKRGLRMYKLLFPSQDRYEIADSLGIIAALCGNKNEHDNALKFALEGLQIYENLYPKQAHPEKINLLLNIAISYLHLKDPVQGLSHLDRVYHMIPACYPEATAIKKKHIDQYEWLKAQLEHLQSSIQDEKNAPPKSPNPNAFHHSKRPEILQKIHQAYKAANPNMTLAAVPTTQQAWHFASVLPSSNAELLRALYHDMTDDERSRVVNNQDKQGKTALHKAVQKNCLEEAAYLLTLTAIDVEKKDNADKTALNYAVSDEMKLLFNNHTKECTR